MAQHTFSIVPRGPFGWEAAVSSLCRLPVLGHVWSGDARGLRLSLLADGDFAPVDVALRFEGGALRGEVSDPSRAGEVERQVARMFSLDHDGTGWGALAAREPELGALVRRFSGLRPVCFSSPYETACWAVVSQRVQRAQAARVMASLIAAVGARGHFPHPERLRRVRTLRGLADVKVARLRGVAEAALAGALEVSRLRALGEDAATKALREVPGVGAFWSVGIYLRACGAPDVFPDEPRSVAALARLYRLGAAPSREAVARVTDRFRPFRSWACFLLRVADARGALAA